MSPTKEASERQRRAAFKAWETIRRKASGEGSGGKDTKKRTRTILAKASEYPRNWKQIVAEILNRARNEYGQEQCECAGECLKHGGRCEEINHTWAKHRRSKGKVTIRLTTAHLCHNKRCSERRHLKAMCEPCHLIYDLRCRQQCLQGSRAIKWAMGHATDASGQDESAIIRCNAAVPKKD